MAVRPVLRVPDPRLKVGASTITDIDGSVLALAADLVDTMRAHSHSVGIAATQIGVAMRACVVDVTGHPKARSSHGELILFNPEVESAEGMSVSREGCMSIPSLTGDVARPLSVVVRGLTPDGEVRLIEADSFEARALLHEIDHLDGKLFLHRVASRSSVFRRRTYR